MKPFDYRNITYWCSTQSRVDVDAIFACPDRDMAWRMLMARAIAHNRSHVRREYLSGWEKR